MPTLKQFLWLQSLESVIDFSPRTVQPETLVSQVISLMADWGVDVLVVSVSEVVGWLTAQDIVKLVASGIDFNTAKISEVMHTTVTTLKISELDDLTTVLSRLRQHQLKILPIVDEQGRLIGTVTPESICQAIEAKIEQPKNQLPEYIQRLDLPKSTAYQNLSLAERTTKLNLTKQPLLSEISDRQTIKQQLQQSQQMLRLVMDTIPHSILWKDVNSVILGCNRNFAKLVGVEKPEEIVGKTAYDFLHSKLEADFHHDCDARVIKTNKPEYHIIAPLEQVNRRKTWLEIHKIPLHNKAGNVVGVLATIQDITARQQAQEALEKSQERFHFLAESIPQQVWIANANGNIEYVNQRSLDYFDCSLEQVLGWAWQQWLHPDDLSQCLADWQASLATGKPLEGEFRWFKSSDQTYRWHLVRAVPWRDQDGKINAWFGTTTDIHDRVTAELALKESEQRFRNLVESSYDLIWEVDQNCTYTYVSPKIRDILGYEPQAVLGKTPLDFMPPELQETLAPGFAAILATPQPFECLENIQIHQDGHLVLLETSGVPIVDSAGKFIGYRGTNRDITKRKQAEVDLLVSQQRLQYLLSSSPAVIYTAKISSDFSPTFISENIKVMMGYEPQKIIADPSFWMKHIHPEDLSDVIAKLQNIYQPEDYRLEYRFLHKNGTYRWVFDQSKLVRNDIGNPLERIGYWVDITERKQLEQELRVALDKEKELNELKSRFVSMTSHEFRTPLSTILSSAELLEYYGFKWTEEKRLTHLRRIQIAVKRMNEMLNDVLVIGQSEAGKLEYNPTVFDLVAYCSHIIKEARLNQSNNCLISFISKYSSLSCCMDSKLLGYILNNLLSNAIKYSPEGSTVNVKLACENAQAVLEIQDQGIGIPSEDLPYLFESFHRARNVGNILGFGLGLAIVKRCVDIHKGKISVTSTLGTGTTFIVTLPLNNAMKIEGKND